MKPSTFLTGALLACVAAGAAHAQGSAAQAAVDTFNSKIGELQQQGVRISYDQAAGIARDALTGVDFSGLTVGDIELLNDSQLLDLGGKMAVARERLTTFATQPTADGAAAAVLLFATAGEDASVDQRAELVRAALHHEGLTAALSAGRGAGIFSSLGQLPTPVLGDVFDEVVGLGQYITTDLPPMVVAGLPEMLDGLLGLEGERYEAGRETLRKRMVEAVRGTVEKTDDPRLADYLSSRLLFLDGAFARGELVGHVAPGLDFTWTNSEGELRTLEDLRGKVVVLDFWATWCGPCVASFPRVREMVARYEGYDVAVVGVTSLQGSHFAPDGTRTDTEGDPDLEYRLMAEYIPQKDITWTVAFAEQEVFNPEYGIQGIPHVAILDPEGRVRYRGLHPMEPGKEAKIDGLLREAGLRVPESDVAPASFDR